MVRVWSGREVRALRGSQRLSIREFAARIGVSERMVSRWEAGGERIRPRPINQEGLDSLLASASDDVQTRVRGCSAAMTLSKIRVSSQPPPG